LWRASTTQHREQYSFWPETSAHSQRRLVSSLVTRTSLPKEAQLFVATRVLTTDPLHLFL
jgi:hypothetical protein